MELRTILMPSVKASGSGSMAVAMAACLLTTYNFDLHRVILWSAEAY